jgi:hypothetical protein
VYDTMAVPDLAAVEASLERSRLLLDYGIEAVAMALDASASIEAANSLEKMLAHQLAVAHKTAMEQIGRAHGACAPDTEIKRLNVATRFMSVFQQGLLTLKKLRQGGRQQITVQYVNVSHGSQAVIGSVENGRGGREAAVGGVRKSGLFNGGGVCAKPLLQYWKLNVPLIWPSSFVMLFGEKGLAIEFGANSFVERLPRYSA